MTSEGRLQELLADILDLPPATIDDDLAMKDVEAWDSLKHMELITAIEAAYGIELTFDEIVSMQSVAAIRRLLDGRAASR
jgi:acyl carrier protein